ncbi:MAG: nicotinic acid mononucleotide adenylyltransferase [Bacteroidetes bacterium GWF2_42_66]|nr:MAG: nicotinic acid mononucleotide adenylyltransferase [Bacteroidetes bacterium GWA2_42_15]OFX98077.1 MAG: nicotinic acid mononucleotide adenylyltransferase [Bacteroidetes bacterium GWE2_42_39]OFY42460.1 MAG: nicotinic acid mononucleotide adenylyltransferase [Bacteroidetes bacterium GWF2_42_66]HBL74171.1 nicotinic acid mononucleotide adenylyltransferase [Prolixibacteraceae bacterium]HCR91657.1 nicotinic acid mononucleotide adenylyltransferase [Prolixibacteraceae bacterium]
MKIGLYFGTFNPIHIGHLAIANYMLEFAGIDQLWFVVSPQSPFKQKQNMLDDYQRLELVNRAIGDDLRMRVSSIEFKLPKPSYTIDTLTYLQEEFPAHRFSILMGSDNLENFHKWKNYEQIIENYPVIIYPRPGFDPLTVEVHKNIHITDAPIMEISATFIREAIKAGKDVRHFVPAKAWQYIEEMHFYTK